MGLESSLQSSALKYLNGIKGCKAENVSGNSKQSGRPDITGCYNGRMLKIELKVPDNRNSASKKQTYELFRWARAGAAVGVIYSLSTLKDMIDSLEENKFKVTGKRFEVYETNGCISWYQI